MTAPSRPNSSPGARAAASREPERAQRTGKGPEEEHRLVGERLAQEPRGDVVAAFHHLLSDGRVQALVGIDQRVMQGQGKQEQREREQDERGNEAAVVRSGGSKSVLARVVSASDPSRLQEMAFSSPSRRDPGVSARARPGRVDR